MNVTFSARAWSQYLSWQHEDVKTARKINDLIKECQRTPFDGSGQPEALRNQLKGLWSRRIDQKNRLVYRVLAESVEIVQCRYHYDDH